MAAFTPVTPRFTTPTGDTPCGGGAAVITTTSRDGVLMRLPRLLSPILCVVVVVACVGASLLLVSVASALEVHEPVGSFGVSGPGSAGFSTVQGVAVDHSSGDVFVYDNDELAGGSVYKFNAAGEPSEFSGLKADVIHGVGFGGFPAVQELAVSEAGPTKGDLYAANDSTVNIYSTATGEKLGELNSEVPAGAPWGGACGVAVDASGTVYVGTEAHTVNRYEPSGEVVRNEDWSGSLWKTPVEACDLAVDQEHNTYVTMWEAGPVNEYPPAEYHETEVEAKPTRVADPAGSSVAIDPVNNDLYVDEQSKVSQFSSSGTLLSVSGGIGESFGVATTGANGKLYVANKSTVEIFGPGENPPPAVSNSTPIYNLTRSSVVLKASASGRGSALTGCHFEYGTTTGYGSGGPCEYIPNAGGEPVLQVDGLTPGVTYHFRLVAESSVGSTNGPDATFTTPNPPPLTCTNGALRVGPSASLPDCRAYEQVSPVDKGGADIYADGTTDRLSTDGNTADFVSSAAFAGAESVAPSAEYLATRTATGWETHSVSPKQGSLNSSDVNVEKPFYDLVSPDLGTGVYLAISPLTDYPDTEKVNNIYVRRDLRSSGAGVYELQSRCPGCEAPGGSPLDGPESILAFERAIYHVAGASADFSHVVFATAAKLTSNAPGSCTGDLEECPVKLYDAHDGTVSLVGILPDGSVAPAADAGAGIANQNEGNSIVAPHVVSSDGSRIIFTDTSVGDIYERIDDAATVQINASERSTPDGFAPAEYLDASADGTRVFFKTSQSLTEDAPAGGGLYLWDAEAPEHHRLTWIPAPSVTSAIGASSDGHYFYFTSGSEGTAGGGVAAYVWHDGTIRYISGGLTNNDSAQDAASGLFRNLIPHESRITGDGRHLLFEATGGVAANEVGYEQRRNAEMYAYDYGANSLVCASCNPSGAPASAEALTLERLVGVISVASFVDYLSHGISEDGRYVFFTTAEALVPQDTNGVSDAYEYDTATGQVHLLSTGKSPEPSVFLDATPDGSNALIYTFQSLVGQDRDLNSDVYDARVNGGIAAQQPALATLCAESLACQGQGSGPRGMEASPSVTFIGPGNPPPPPPPPASGSARISVSGARIVRGSVALTVDISAPGRITISGRGVVRLARPVSRAGRYRFTVPLTSAERRSLRTHRHRLGVQITLATSIGTAKVNASAAAGR
jgi:hypothetical protein